MDSNQLTAQMSQMVTQQMNAGLLMWKIMCDQKQLDSRVSDIVTSFSLENESLKTENASLRKDTEDLKNRYRDLSGKQDTLIQALKELVPVVKRLIDDSSINQEIVQQKIKNLTRRITILEQNNRSSSNSS